MLNSSSKEATDTIIFAPHVDDEVLGCFAYLNASCHVLYGGVEERPTISRETRIQELKTAASLLGFGWTLLNNPVNSYQSQALIGDMEALIQQIEPTTVLIPEPSYNQDHRAFYDAGLVATRPHDTLWLVPEVLVYEQPHSVMWPHSQREEPSVFLPIDIDKKLQAYALYASQVRGHRSPETVKAIATLRGAQINTRHAEAFISKRVIKHPGLQ